MRRTQVFTKIKSRDPITGSLLEHRKSAQGVYTYMKASFLKKTLPLAVALLMLAGCGRAPAREAEEGAAQEPVVIGEPAALDAAGTAHSSLFSVDSETRESSGETYASDTANVNVVLVENAGVLTMTSVDINKTGDSAGDFSGGQNAAAAVLTKGQMTLNGSNITTNATGAPGIFVAGEGTQLALNDTSVYTSSESSPVIIVREDASAMVTSGMLSTEGADSPCILLLGGRLTLSGVTLSSTSGDILRVSSGDNFLTLDNTAVTAMPSIGDEATLVLRLSNSASFTGALGGTLPARSSVYLDATSKLTLTAETYLTVLVNADLTHANIESNGFNLYYDSSAEENAYLNSQSFLLPGGGFLAPII